MKRGLKITLLAIPALLMLIVLTLVAVLGTPTGSRWALGFVPGLTVENFQGRLGGQWSADHLVWQQDSSRVELNKAIFAWSPLCLMRMTLCIEQLQAEQVSLQFPPGVEEESSGPISLPDLKLPLAIELGDVKIGRLLFNGSEELKGLQLAAHWTEKGLQIDSVHLQRDELSLNLSGLLQPSGNWPLTAEGKLTLPSPGTEPWALALKVDGDLLKTLNLKADSSGYLNGQLTGELQPLAENLPAKVRITADGFKASTDLPDTLQLNQLELTGDGDLKNGYQLLGKATLPAEQGPVALVLQGKVDARGAQIAGLDLTANDKQSLKLTGKVDWSKGLSFDAKIDWLDFPWHRLYPLIDEPQVALRSFNGEVSYTDGNYIGNFKAALDGPAGAFSLNSPFSGDLTKIHLPQFKLEAGQGKAEGHLNLQFADGIAWDTALDLSAINPAYWLAELPGTLAGPLRSKGEMKNETLSLTADLDLKGKLRGQPAVLQAKADGGGEQWNLSALQIRLGDNSINGQGSLQQKLAGRIDIKMPRLAQLWPQLRGQLNGRVDVAGTLKAPQGKLGLQGTQLAFEDNRLQSLNLDATLDSAQRAKIDLKGGGIQTGDTSLGTLTASGQGDIKNQKLALDLQGPKLKLALGLDGTLDKGNWRGRLASGDIQAGGQDWKLQNPAKLERLADGKINFGAHCWMSGPASLCGEDQRLMPEPKLRYHLKQFPIDSLAQWLPKDFAWKGKLNADLQLDLPASGPNGQISIDASGGTLRMREKEQWLDFPYQTLKLTSKLTPKRIDTDLNFVGGKLGELMVQAQINPLPKNKPLTGSFRLSGLDLSVARPFVPMVEKLTGHLSGSGTLSGGLLAPLVNGNLELRDGEISGPELPMALEALQLQAVIAGETVQLNGGWKSGKTGQGSLNGNIAWGQALVVDLALKGSHLPVTVEPYAALEVAPDLKISMKDDRLAIVGKVLVPKGEITVRELPPSTVKVSDDTVIVGQQTEEGKPPMAMAMDIDVVVGQDKLSFAGFGLTANLQGQVHIGDNMDTRGELWLNDGRYRAYGQRLTVRRARLLFAGPIDQPYLDIEAIRQTDDIIAGIRLSGSAEQPTTQIFSEPAMSQEQALSYLVLGRPLSTTGEDNNMLAQAALGLGLMGSSGVTSGLAKDLGIQDFQLDTQGSGANTAVVASGNISEKLSLRYGVGVFEPANTIALRYKLSKKVYLEAASGVASSLDIFYKRDF
ncbi:MULTISPECIES: translocation/assembly module TamB domain-containing protein [unclassified Pseudomonas]|uniref:translocation/assembly module TamB domain-containing protein n=1 Tax=unclassified Pseudomonas TaxID=196821 RepID=UPI001914CDBD|nr:translocation/assembly module TamB [Pseudomonas sp. TH71]MBK5370314.1 translocation/assembly module TamB [Pseudomonas sp. TH40]MBK5381483.1 translocation/assembly module TamB [Pseudomonas sp. TH35]MBK5386942.1 translocation/assembly module TamB [Pseudomonas sp. TH38]MBK5404237.1 translocation/assembly module TamB [Pseudomonas sp. TH37]MBK5466335.1 translocation/assembly module TamB [Pseudomonas sp. TH20]MBK5522614.1 translocation/assembly module TamB [Pseudomonas sp. TH09]